MSSYHISENNKDNFNQFLQTLTTHDKTEPSIYHVDALPDACDCFLYFLYNYEDQLIYIGTTTDPYIRLKTHAKSKNVLYMKVWAIPIFHRYEIEASYIRLYRPLNNISIPPNSVWKTYHFMKKTYPQLKGKRIRIKKILKSKGWEWPYESLLIEQWKEILSNLEGVIS